MSEPTPSERYHEALRQAMQDEPLTTDMAREVWSKVHEILHSDPDGGVLRCLYDQLNRELVTGKRCGVCGRYESSDCWEEC